MNFKLNFNRRKLAISTNLIDHLESKTSKRRSLFDPEVDTVNPSDWCIRFIEHFADATIIINEGPIDIRKPVTSHCLDECEPAIISSDILIGMRVPIISFHSMYNKNQNFIPFMTQKRSPERAKKNGSCVSAIQSDPQSVGSAVARRTPKAKVITTNRRKSNDSDRPLGSELRPIFRQRNPRPKTEAKSLQLPFLAQLKSITRFENDQSSFVIKKKSLEKTRVCSTHSKGRERIAAELLNDAQLQTIGQAYYDSPAVVSRRGFQDSSLDLYLPIAFLKTRKEGNLKSAIAKMVAPTRHLTETPLFARKIPRIRPPQIVTPNDSRLSKIFHQSVASKTKDKFFIHKVKLDGRGKNDQL